VRKTGETPCGRERAEPLRKGFCCCFSAREGVAGRNRPARGVAQDAPFFTAARLERRAGALTETGRK